MNGPDPGRREEHKPPEQAHVQPTDFVLDPEMVAFESALPPLPNRPLERGTQRRMRKDKTAALEALLVGASPAQILARIQDGDPLEVGALSLERMRARALLIALDRLTARAMARAAYAAFLKPVHGQLHAWLLERVDHALTELIAEDRRQLLEGVEIIQPSDWRYQFLANAMSVTCEVARRACVAFNALPDEVRCDYWATCVEETPLEKHAAATKLPAPRILANTRRAILTLSRLEDPGDQPPEGADHA